MILCMVLLVATSLACAESSAPGEVNAGEPNTTRAITDDPNPVGQSIVDDPEPIGVEGQGFMFRDHPGVVIYNEGHVKDPDWQWTRLNRLTERRGTWWPLDENTPDDATDSDEECQDYVDDACEGAGFGTGKAGDAEVGPADENGCKTCLGECTGGCNENGCPQAGITQCPD